MPSSQDWARFYRLRREVLRQVGIALKLDPHHKSYEGTLEITFPNYFEDEGRNYEDLPPETHHDGFGITLHAYVLLSNRRETWLGGSLAECLDKLSRWLEHYRLENMERQMQVAQGEAAARAAQNKPAALPAQGSPDNLKSGWKMQGLCPDCGNIMKRVSIPDSQGHAVARYQYFCPVCADTDDRESTADQQR